MKRITSILIALIIICASVAFADPSPSSFLYGTWERIVEYSDLQLNIELFHIFPDHRAYYFSSWFDGKEIEDGHGYEDILSWSFEDGKFYLFFESGYMTYIPVNDTTLKTDETMSVLYHKIYPIRWD